MKYLLLTIHIAQWRELANKIVNLIISAYKIRVYLRQHMNTESNIHIHAQMKSKQNLLDVKETIHVLPPKH